MTLIINGKTYEAGELVAYVVNLEKENAELKRTKEGKVVEHFEAFGQCRDSRRIAELEKEISVLLSCKNCPENNGGLICQKEYEDKCLAQKIEFIKELQKEIAELKAESDFYNKERGNYKAMFLKATLKNNKAKELLKQWLQTSMASGCDNINIVTDTEQFLSEVEK